MTPVGHEPQPLAALQSRYPLALEHVYDVEKIVTEGGIRPGEAAANVFDFEDGLRLIISRERHPGGAVFLHFSASFAQHCRIADEFRLLAVATPRERIMRMWMDGIPARFAELSGDARPPFLLGRSTVGVPHWAIEEE